MTKLNKKGIELQVNFIVILILTLVIFGASMAIAYKVLKKTNELKGQVDSTTQSRLEELMSNGNEAVIIPFPKEEGAKRGEALTFGMGIANLVGNEKNFWVKITPSRKIDPNGNSVTFSSWTHSYPTYSDVATLKNNQNKIVPLIIIVNQNAERGSTYIFDVNVAYGSDCSSTSPSNCTDYPKNDPIKKIRITVVD